MATSARSEDRALGGHGKFMDQLLKLAREALAEGEAPLAALVRKEARVLTRARATPAASGLRQHPELMALDSAGEAARDGSLYVTVEPCAMCLGAAALLRVKEVIYAVADPQEGGFHTVIYTGELATRAPAGIGGICREQVTELIREYLQRQPRGPESARLRALLAS